MFYINTNDELLFHPMRPYPPEPDYLSALKAMIWCGNSSLDLEGSALVLGWRLIPLIPVTLQDNVTRLPLPHNRHFTTKETRTAKVCNPNAGKK